MRCEVEDCGDGTWRSTDIHPNTGTRLNSTRFPTEQEARWFAAACEQGYTHTGAMMVVHDKRLGESRASGGVIRPRKPDDSILVSLEPEGPES